jgi:hypothetical protein
VTTTSCNAAALKRFERSEAVEPFDRTQGRRLKRLERADPGGFVLTGIKPSLIPLNRSISKNATVAAYAEILLLTVNKRFDPFGRPQAQICELLH